MEANYEVIKELGTLNDARNSFELNLVSWNGAIEKYDIRRWNEEGKLISLKDILTQEIKEIDNPISKDKIDVEVDLDEDLFI